MYSQYINKNKIAIVFSRKRTYYFKNVYYTVVDCCVLVYKKARKSRRCVAVVIQSVLCEDVLRVKRTVEKAKTRTYYFENVCYTAVACVLDYK